MLVGAMGVAAVGFAFATGLPGAGGFLVVAWLAGLAAVLLRPGWTGLLVLAGSITVAAVIAGSPRIERSDRAVSTVAFFWSRVGYLVRKGHMDLGLVCEELGDQIQWWYERLGPWDDPGPWQHFVWLAGAAATFDAKRGITRALPDAASLARALPSMIEHFRQAVEYEEALRTVPVRFVAAPIPVMGVRPDRQPGRDDGLSEGAA